MIRTGTSADFGSMEGLWDGFDQSHVARSSYLFRRPSREEKLFRHKKYSEGPAAFFLLYFDDAGDPSVPVGFIAGQFRATPDVTLLRAHSLLELHAIFVRPESRGSEAADALLGAAVREAEARSVDDVVCHIWAFNETAEALVLRAGFTRSSSKYSLHAGHDAETGVSPR